MLQEKMESSFKESKVQITENTEELFERFKKAGSHPQSLGIGLSIVKRICDISGIDITYECIGTEHRFILQKAISEN